MRRFERIVVTDFTEELWVQHIRMAAFYDLCDAMRALVEPAANCPKTPK